MTKLIDIAVSAQEKQQKPIDWLDNKFVSCEDLFPKWKTARPELGLFCSLSEGWHLQLMLNRYQLGLQFPLIVDSTGEYVPMIQTFPEIYQSTVQEICLKVMEDYLPDLTTMINSKITECTPANILNYIKSREDWIVHHGGFSVLNELQFRLGLTWYFKD